MHPFSTFILSGFGTTLGILGLKFAAKNPIIPYHLVKINMMILSINITSLLVSTFDIVYMF
jgi:hypothetical protein